MSVHKKQVTLEFKKHQLLSLLNLSVNRACNKPCRVKVDVVITWSSGPSWLREGPEQGDFSGPVV